MGILTHQWTSKLDNLAFEIKSTEMVQIFWNSDYTFRNVSRPRDKHWDLCMRFHMALFIMVKTKHPHNTKQESRVSNSNVDH